MLLKLGLHFSLVTANFSRSSWYLIGYGTEVSSNSHIQDVTKIVY
jgi:hypothetical protein